MKTVLVRFCIKKGFADDFIGATAINVAESRKEAGVSQFDFFRAAKEQHVFYLLETYDTAEAQTQHRETEHYKTWKACVADFLDSPYTVTELLNCAP
jgi:quinol monooxygenase YgiN